MAVVPREQQARASAEERGKGQGGVGSEGRVLEHLHIDTRAHDAHPARCGARSRMAATSTDRCRPLRHFTEHVAGSNVGKVKRRSGPLPGRI
jgi:hypothetical protein